MSQENVEIVRSFYDAWARHESPGPIELMDREIEYVNPAGAVEPGTRQGVAAFSRAVGKVFDGWEAWEVELEKFTEVGDQVAVILRYPRARPRERRRSRGSRVGLVDSPQRQGLAVCLVSRAGRRPRSRRAIRIARLRLT
jgi:ketosteroid isomerase-like protein